MINKEELMKDPDVVMIVTYDDGTIHDTLIITQGCKGARMKLKAFMKAHRALKKKDS